MPRTRPFDMADQVDKIGAAWLVERGQIGHPPTLGRDVQHLDQPVEPFRTDRAGKSRSGIWVCARISERVASRIATSSAQSTMPRVFVKPRQQFDPAIGAGDLEQRVEARLVELLAKLRSLGGAGQHVLGLGQTPRGGRHSAGSPGRSPAPRKSACPGFRRPPAS